MDPSTLDKVTALATAAAAVAAAWAAWQASRATSQTATLVNIETRRRQDEEMAANSARMIVTVEQVPRLNDTTKHDPVVRLTNGGPSHASDVNVTSGARGLLLHHFPIAKLGAGSSVDIPTAFAMGDDPTVDAEIEWADGNGQHRERRVLSIY